MEKGAGFTGPLIFMYALIVSLIIAGDAPICSFDGYIASCYYYTWEQCESAIQNNSSARCIANPNLTNFNVRGNYHE